MTDDEIGTDYEKNTGRVIAERFRDIDYAQVPATVVHGHGAFCWAADASTAVELAVMLEEIAFMAWHTISLEPDIPPMKQSLLDKHYLRKHGPGAYYGQ